MKKLSILTLLALGIYSNAQFNIKGEIKNYSNKPILVKTFTNGTEKIVKNISTNAAGTFETNIPVVYNGMIKLELPLGAKIDLISANENISFTSVLTDKKIQNIKVIEGSAFKDYQNINQLEPLNDIKNNLFKQLKGIYTPEDTFYKAIELEQKRIEELNNKLKITTSTVKYIHDLKTIINETKEPAKAGQMLPTILNHIEKDDEKLEQSGLMSDLIYSYINTKFSSAPNSTNADDYLILVTNELLEKGNIETARGQNILSMILNMAPEENFPKFFDTYKSKVQALTCTITEDLKGKFTPKTTIKVGDIAPNIIFDSAVKGKKSLYDIKSKKKLVVFWASWCPACINEIPYIKDYYSEFKKNGGEIVAISLDYDEQAFKNATKDFEWYNYTDLFKWDSPIAKSFDVNSTPTLFLLDENNKIIEKVNHITDLKNK